MLKFLFSLACEGNLICCFKTNIPVMPAEEFTYHMYSTEEHSVCARDIYENDGFEHFLAICCKYLKFVKVALFTIHWSFGYFVSLPQFGCLLSAEITLLWSWWSAPLFSKEEILHHREILPKQKGDCLSFLLPALPTPTVLANSYSVVHAMIQLLCFSACLVFWESLAKPAQS